MKNTINFDDNTVEHFHQENKHFISIDSDELAGETNPEMIWVLLQTAASEQERSTEVELRLMGELHIDVLFSSSKKPKTFSMVQKPKMKSLNSNVGLLMNVNELMS